jgi:hypothetical protein
MQELYRYLHPKSERLPYAYDSLRWRHCELIGQPVSPA